MNYKNVLMLGCSNRQLPYAEYFKSKNLNVLIVDKSETTSTNGFEQIRIGYDETLRIINKLRELNYKPDIVFTAADQISHIYASQLSDMLHVEYRVTEDLAKIINTKFHYYEMFVEQGLSIPVTEYYTDKKSLDSALIERLADGAQFYVKSDYSKNPRYVYRISDQTQLEKVNWTKDRHLQKGYVLQPVVEGECYRINLFDDMWVVFDFASGIRVSHDHALLQGCISKLQNCVKNLELLNEVVKFDVICNEINGYSVLDIGLDPPSRLLNHCCENNIDFTKAYCELALGNKKPMKELFENFN